MEEYILEVKNLNKKFKRFQLKDININVPKNSIVGFIGKNGAGKSTTIKSITNLIEYDSGNILIDGIKANSKKAKEIIGYVGDKSYFYRDISCKEISEFIKKFYKNWDDSKFETMINLFNLNLDLQTSELSRGMDLKFNLCLALSHNPKLLIMDEATAGLDPIIRKEVLDMIKNECKNKKLSVFFSSHITEDMINIADIIYFIDNGQILLKEYKDKLLNNYKEIEFTDDFPEEIKKQLISYKLNKGITDNIEKFKNKKYIKKIEDISLENILISLIEKESD